LICNIQVAVDEIDFCLALLLKECTHLGQLLANQYLSLALQVVVPEIKAGLFTLGETEEGSAQEALRVNLARILVLLGTSFQCFPLRNDVIMILLVVFDIFQFQSIRCGQRILALALTELGNLNDVLVID